MAAIFPPEDVSETIGEVFAEFGLEAAAHRRNRKIRACHLFHEWRTRRCSFAGEDRILVPSPKIATYDLKPEMSRLRSDGQAGRGRRSSGKYDLIVVNYANPDMVGHTGVMDAAMKAVEAIDTCLGRLRARSRRPVAF